MNNKFLISIKLSKKDRDYISRVIRCNFPPGTIIIRKHDKKIGSVSIDAVSYRESKKYIGQHLGKISNLFKSGNDLFIQVFIMDIGFTELYVGKCSLMNNSFLSAIAHALFTLKDVPLNIIIRKIKRQLKLLSNLIKEGIRVLF